MPIDVKKAVAGGTAAAMAIAAGALAIGGDVKDAISIVQLAKRVISEDDEKLAEMKASVEAGAKRSDAAIVELQLQLKDTLAALDYEKGRNQALENTIGTMAEKLCQSPQRKR
jgi:hypothetical protein